MIPNTDLGDIQGGIAPLFDWADVHLFERLIFMSRQRS
jgi:hypothetical protein